MLGNAIKIAIIACVAAVAAVAILSNRIPQANPVSPAPRAAQAVQPLNPSRAFGYGRVELRPDRVGHYTADVEVGGRTLSMLVDTGATVVSLRYEDAQNLGLRPGPGDFKVPISTANGVSRAAEVRLSEVRIGSIRAVDVQAIVLPQGAAEKSLLGMSFLRKLGGFEIASGNLILKP
ncbi:MAG: TIGR02281 family clan AA aspartic protease [Beijerinckiaceae bacterium]|jgi:aspartyl protease family protein|nr:TIGR02281 family clan AA aspartic protease [Beijerinckiaceae bacterium]MDO9439995.1 TIGR02281 family clan AA aspartic protease [Beijerinckiaceae bacterium]